MISMIINRILEELFLSTFAILRRDIYVYFFIGLQLTHRKSLQKEVNYTGYFVDFIFMYLFNFIYRFNFLFTGNTILWCTQLTQGANESTEVEFSDRSCHNQLTLSFGIQIVLFVTL